MMLFRPAKYDDIEDIYSLAIAGGIGITTLPANHTQLEQRIEESLASFDIDFDASSHGNYLFVLENTKENKVVGVSAIDAYVGYDLPFYSYKLSKVTRVCHELGLRNEYKSLILVNDYQGASELCTLFLHPDYRINGSGLFLSRARLLFLAQFPERFSSKIIAEMRGISDKEGNSPFWNSLGKHFFHMSFQEADRLTASTNKQFIADLMPRNPIYTALLTRAAQEAIGKPHKSTKPALKILQREGFRFNGYVDIFDAGPTIEARVKEITTVKRSKTLKILKILKTINTKQFFIAMTDLNFKTCLGNVLESEEGCMIDQNSAQTLGLTTGDTVIVSPFK